MFEMRISITVVCMVILGQAVSAPLPQGYFGPPQGSYPPQQYFPPQPGYFPPPPNNMQFFPLPPPPPPPQMSLTDFSYQFQNTVNNNMPMPPLPPVGPNDLGKPMPLEAAAAANAPASSYGGAVVEQELEPTGSANAINAPPQTSLLVSYYNGRPGAATGASDNMLGGLMGAYVMKEYLF